jgi:Ca-activated chloride channel family protein
MELDREILPAGTRDTAVIKVAIDGARLARAETRPPVNLCIVLDRSGSMSGGKIAQAKNAAIEALNHLSPDDIFSLVIFDDRIDTLIPAARIGGNIRALENRIRQITARGNTALFDGVSRGASELRENIGDSRCTHRIVLLSDGQANVGPSSSGELGRLGAALMKEGISVTTIGLGLGYDEDIMARLALTSDGNTYFAENSRDLVKIFDAELGDVLGIVARKAVVTIEFPEGVRPLRFVGREGSIRGQNAELTLNQIYGGQEKYALIEIEISPVGAGSEREIARAKLAFEDAVANTSVTLSATSRARFSADSSVVVKSANHQLQTDYAANRFAEARDKAIAFADAGNISAASDFLNTEAIRMREYSIFYSNGGVRNLANVNMGDAAKIRNRGISNVDRKNFRTDNNNVIMQQMNAGNISILSSGSFGSFSSSGSSGSFGSFSSPDSSGSSGSSLLQSGSAK